MPGSAPPRIASSLASTIIGRIIFYGLLVMIVLVATPYGIVSPWRGVLEAVFECAVFAFGVLWMIEGLLSGVWASRRHLLLLPLIGLCVLALLQTLTLGNSQLPGLSSPAWQAISFDPYETRLMVLKLASYAMALGLLLRYTTSPRRFRILIFVLIGIGVASALFGILRETTQRGAPQFLFPFVRLDRGYGQFVNRNHFAFLMEMVLGLVLGLLVGGGVRRERALIYLAAAIPVWAALVLSNSRGGIFSMLCQLLLLALMFTRVRKFGGSEARDDKAQHVLTRLGASPLVRVALGLVLLGAILIGVAWIGGEQLASRFENVPGELAAESQDTRMGVRRSDIWRATWQMIKENPLTGVGLGGYWTAIAQYHNASGKFTPQQAHNDYLELLASGGIIGVLLGGWFAYLLTKFARERLRSADRFRRAAAFGAVLGIFGIAVHSLIDFGLHIPPNAIGCLALIAIATLNGRVDDHREHKSRFRRRRTSALSPGRRDVTT